MRGLVGALVDIAMNALTWWMIWVLYWMSLILSMTGCVQRPLASYRDPQTGMLCWARLDADEMHCTTPSRTP